MGQQPSREGSGILIVGSKGTMYSPTSSGGSYRLLPEANFKGYQAPEADLAAFAGTSRRVGPRLQGRNGSDGQLRLRRAAHGNGPARQRRHPRRPATHHLGFRQPAR